MSHRAWTLSALSLVSILLRANITLPAVRRGQYLRRICFARASHSLGRCRAREVAAYSPAAAAIIVACDWGRPWLGKRTPKTTLRNLGRGAEAVRVSLELTGATTASETRRRKVVANQIRIAPSRQANVGLNCELSRRGAAPLELLVCRAGSDRVVAGRVRYVYMPPLLAAIEAPEKRVG